MVAAAFDSLLSNEETQAVKTSAADGKPDDIDEQIINAKTVTGLLSVTDANGSAVTRKHALKVTSYFTVYNVK